jgi:hypothetical protein
MTPTQTSVVPTALFRAVKELEAAEERAHASAVCGVCKARQTLAVEQARERVVHEARRLV